MLKTGLSNVNAWILTLTYGMCFGIELTMNSVVAGYFHAYHGLTVELAGLIGDVIAGNRRLGEESLRRLRDLDSRRAPANAEATPASVLQE